ncbi:MAG TPA: carboxymuconolactone decarboxylase family protein [Oligoflexus sp.]|uniref:carboxymuconolactone decarboxylase family protein n=1 Tax=Oligoflexus sp. TaxID=1971216 RepID=UPI002D8083E2|nr:carboxymuconolactone decarboxylase family protein [Oligoflexus sp.]HET9237147.1 carboxymuconolactone decarboxylase family protein [Oligoflexus sp.]
MSARINYYHQAPQLLNQISKLSLSLNESSLDTSLRDLVNIRASTLNGCAFCLDMHVKEARIHGERDLRVHHTHVWRESPLFTAREKAALEWTEAVTRLSREGIPDDLYQRTREYFSEKELTELTVAIGVINLWNRLAISFQAPPGSADKTFGLDKAGLS